MHWHVLFFDFTFPVSPDERPDDGDDSAVVVLQKSPALLVAATDLVLLPLVAVVASATADIAAAQLDRREDSRNGPVVAGPLCDTARLTRSGVLIA